MERRGRSTPCWPTRRWNPDGRVTAAAARTPQASSPARVAAAGPGRNDTPGRMSDVALWRRLTAEFIGSAFLAALVIGSGIAAQQLSPGATGLQLFENAAATAAGLAAIIMMFGPVSGGHFNPVVSFVDAAFGAIRWKTAGAYLPAQVTACVFVPALPNVVLSP